jgi:uncharacterized repeat protein (TIGR01451 family)
MVMTCSVSAATFTPADVAGLVAAINAANTNGQSDTIELDGRTFTLTAVDNTLDGPNGLPAILPDGGSTLTIRNGTIERGLAAPELRFIHVGSGATVVLDSATLRRGNVQLALGAAILNLGTLSVAGSTLSEGLAAAGWGGAIHNSGTLSVTDSTFRQNGTTGAGGAISNDGTLTVTGSTFLENASGLFGGAIYNTSQGMISIRNCTFSSNYALRGGAILNSSTVSSITNTSIAFNQSDSPRVEGGGIVNEEGATIGELASCIVAENVGGGFRTDILNEGTIGSASNNVIGDGSGSGLIDGVNGNQVGTSAAPLDPLVGPLTNNGGPTFTHALLPGSPAINAGSNPAALANDQRGPGFSRVSGAQADVGAFELQSADLSVTKVDTPDPVTAGERLTYTITVQNAGPDVAMTVGFSDTLPVGTTFVSLGSPGGWSCSTPSVGANGTVGCPIAAFPVGSATFSIVVTVDWLTPVGTVLWNAATINAITPDPDSDDRRATATTTVVSPAVLSATKAVTGDFRPGGRVTYTIALRNAGPGTQLDNPGDELVDVLPSELALVSAHATYGTAVATVGTNTVTWNGTVVAGDAVEIAIQATVRATTPEGTRVSNQATIAFDRDGNGTNEAAGVSDDPATTAGGDPTVFVAVDTAVVPVLGGFGLLAMAALVGAAGLAVRPR